MERVIQFITVSGCSREAFPGPRVAFDVGKVSRASEVWTRSASSCTQSICQVSLVGHRRTSALGIRAKMMKDWLQMFDEDGGLRGIVVCPPVTIQSLADENEGEGPICCVRPRTPPCCFFDLFVSRLHVISDQSAVTSHMRHAVVCVVISVCRF